MMSFEEWLLKKQRMSLHWFNTMVPDKRRYWKKWHEYKERVNDFHEAVIHEECVEAAREILALG